MASIAEALEGLRDPLLKKIWIGDAVRASIIPGYVGLLMLEGVRGTIAGGVVASHEEVRCGDQTFHLPLPDLGYVTTDGFELGILKAMDHRERDLPT